VLAGGRLWVVSAEGVMVSVDAKTGSIMSQRDLGTPVFIAPIVASGRMYVLTDKARLLALN
ncbi:MAG TPA: pyrrolo-quinoline quinone, partial [Rhizobiales bacterium]|nr:pyrrolo-quinoline quinone [Hyphomicrobiales bacterium]